MLAADGVKQRVIDRGFEAWGDYYSSGVEFEDEDAIVVVMLAGIQRLCWDCQLSRARSL